MQIGKHQEKKLEKPRRVCGKYNMTLLFVVYFYFLSVANFYYFFRFLVIFKLKILINKNKKKFKKLIFYLII